MLVGYFLSRDCYEKLVRKTQDVSGFLVCNIIDLRHLDSFFTTHNLDSHQIMLRSINDES